MERYSTRNHENAAADPSAASARADSGRDDSAWGYIQGPATNFQDRSSTALIALLRSTSLRMTTLMRSFRGSRNEALGARREQDRVTYASHCGTFCLNARIRQIDSQTVTRELSSNDRDARDNQASPAKSRSRIQP